jgi:hypothetical protein
MRFIGWAWRLCEDTVQMDIFGHIAMLNAAVLT